jgi:TPR repeat protein
MVRLFVVLGVLLLAAPALAQHAPEPMQEPLTVDQIAGIGKAVTALPDHPFDAENSATAAGHAAFDKHDYVSAQDAWLGLALKGNAAAVYFLGVMYLAGDGVPPDAAAAAELFTICGEADNPSCQRALMNAYQIGAGVAKDADKVQYWTDRFHHNPYVSAAN